MSLVRSQTSEPSQHSAKQGILTLLAVAYLNYIITEVSNNNPHIKNFISSELMGPLWLPRWVQMWQSQVQTSEHLKSL